MVPYTVRDRKLWTHSIVDVHSVLVTPENFADEQSFGRLVDVEFVSPLRRCEGIAPMRRTYCRARSARRQSVASNLPLMLVLKQLFALERNDYLAERSKRMTWPPQAFTNSSFVTVRVPNGGSSSIILPSTQPRKTQKWFFG